MKLPVKAGVNACWIVDADGELVAVASKELYRVILIEVLNRPTIETELPGGGQKHKEEDDMKTTAPLITALLCIVVTLLSGCSETTKNAIDSAYATLKNDAAQDAGPLAQAGINLALKKAYTKSPTKTIDAANAFVTMVNNDAIPYFSAQPVLAASALSDLLTTKVGAIIPPSVKGILDLSAVISNITNAITIPGESKLTPNETDIILRALKGAVAGAQAFLISVQPPAINTPPATTPQAVPPGSSISPLNPEKSKHAAYLDIDGNDHPGVPFNHCPWLDGVGGGEVCRLGCSVVKLGRDRQCIREDTVAIDSWSNVRR